MFITSLLAGVIPLIIYAFIIYSVLKTLKVLEEIRDAILGLK